MKENLTVDEAYAAMFRFLNRLYELTGEEYYETLLPGMQLIEPGKSLDPDCFISFEEAAASVKAGKVDPDLMLNLK